MFRIGTRKLPPQQRQALGSRLTACPQCGQKRPPDSAIFSLLLPLEQLFPTQTITRHARLQARPTPPPSLFIVTHYLALRLVASARYSDYRLLGKPAKREESCMNEPRGEGQRAEGGRLRKGASLGRIPLAPRHVRGPSAGP
jgi:hypothetical protein